MKKLVLVAALATAAMAGSAEARSNISVGINSGGYYAPAPVYYAPAPVYYAPPPPVPSYYYTGGPSYSFYYGDGWERHRHYRPYYWHDHGRHNGWRH